MAFPLSYPTVTGILDFCNSQGILNYFLSFLFLLCCLYASIIKEIPIETPITHNSSPITNTTVIDYVPIRKKVSINRNVQY